MSETPSAGWREVYEWARVEEPDGGVLRLDSDFYYVV